MRIRALALILPLAGCLGEGTGEDGLGFLTPKTSETKALGKALPKLSLYNGSIVVAGPRGYCIDASSRRLGLGGSVILIASCQALSGEPGISVEPAVMTVSVLPKSAEASRPTPDELAASMAPAKALKREERNGLSLVHLASGGDSLLPGGSPDYWRASMVLNGHVIGLAAYTPSDTSTSGRTLLIDLADMIRTLSPEQDAAPVTRGLSLPLLGNLAGGPTVQGGLFPESG